jgi:uncharacterized protein YciW
MNLPRLIKSWTDQSNVVDRLKMETLASGSLYFFTENVKKSPGLAGVVHFDGSQVTSPSKFLDQPRSTNALKAGRSNPICPLGP